MIPNQFPSGPLIRMRRKDKTCLEKATVDIWNREIGELSTRKYAHRLGVAEDLVLRFEIYRKLEKHRGCVNAVSFNADGDIVVSGSDDRRVILWDWQTGNVKLSFHSGHHNNVFQAKIMPYTDDQTIVTCAADGQVRRAQILSGGQVETELLGRHKGRAHKLAIEPGSPYIFYTCGEDGLVRHFDLRTNATRKVFTCHAHDEGSSHKPINIVHLNAIAIDPRSPNLFAVAGSDEYTRLYDIRKYKWDATTDFDQPVDYFCPKHLIGAGPAVISGLAFSEQSELLVSYNDECIYLFQKDMGLGSNPPIDDVAMESRDLSGSSLSINTDGETSGFPSSVDINRASSPQVYKWHQNCDTVKGVSFFGPRSEYVVSGSDCGRIFIWRKKDGELIRVMDADKHVVNCIESHPHTAVLASSGIEKDIKIWIPMAVNKATLPKNIEKWKPRARNCLYCLSTPEDLILQYFSLQRRNQEHIAEIPRDEQEFMELVLTFNASSDTSEDAVGDSNDNTEDPFS